MKFLPISLVIILTNLLSLFPNQNYYSTTLIQKKEWTQANPLFKVKQSNLRANQFAGQLRKGTILQIDSIRLHEIKMAKDFKLELDIPFQNQIIQVELHQVNLFADDFKVRTSDSKDPYPVTPGLFYSGHVKNDPKSLVSFSIFDGEVNGIFSLPELGDIALVKTTLADDEYIVFSDNDLTGTQDKFVCLNQDDDTKLNKIRSQVDQHLEERAAGCISVDFEFDDEIYKDFGSNVTTVTNWFTSLFNHVKTIYANEQIEVTIKSLYIWTTADPYSSTVGTALDQVMASRQNDASFTGNLHHLVLGYVSQSVGISGVAYVDVLCSRSFRFGTTRLYQYTTWSTFPTTYQWDIGSIAHEIGHNFGSHHTQWCGWTGGPIDNCYAVEGTCSPGPAPVNGGTIMSYCHLNTNYPMSNGFGPLPHAVVYNNFVAATCKSTSCSGIITPTPTCSDGIQNGDETGVDCGGSCVACGGGGGTSACPSPVLLSQGKTATQSSNYDGVNSYPASKAVDGSSANFHHTGQESQPWMQIDLGSGYNVSSIQVINRGDCASCAGRLKKFRVFVSNSVPTAYSNSGYAYEYNTTGGLANGEVININNLSNQGRYVRVWADFASPNYMHLAEVKVYGCSQTNSCANNTLPTVSISSSSSSYPQNGSFTVNAIASDADGSITKVEFYNGSTLLDTDLSSPYAYTISPANQSSYSISAKAYDDCGGIKTSNVMTITTTSSCSDGIQNGTETGVDCGGSCTACGGTSSCTSGTNVSQGRTTVSQSSTYSSAYPASAANDGSTSNFNHTALESSPWWQVDLGTVKSIGKIEVVNRGGCPSCVVQKRLEKFKIYISTSASPTSGNVVYTNTSTVGDGQIVTIDINPTSGRYVRIQADFSAAANYLHIAELRAFECTTSPTVCANNLPPTVLLQSPAGSYPQGSSFAITANANDQDGNISSVEFFNGNTSLGTVNAAPYSLIISNASANPYSFTAKAVDNCGGIATSSILNIVTTSSCSDGFQNGTETGIDCGGGCAACQGCSSPILLSQGKTATQSSNYNTANTYPASKAFDGSIAGTSFNHTALELQPWLQIDLGSVSTISSIEITHRTGCPTCAGRTKRFRLFVTNTPVTNFNNSGFEYEYNNASGLGDGEVLTLTGLATGRYVRIWANNSTATPLHLAELKVFGCTTGSITLNNAIVDNNSENQDIRLTVFPIPSKKTLNLKFSKEIESEIYASIYDLSGRLLISSEASNHQVDISNLQNGSYILQLKLENGMLFRKKIIKME